MEDLHIVAEDIACCLVADLIFNQNCLCKDPGNTLEAFFNKLNNLKRKYKLIVGLFDFDNRQNYLKDLENKGFIEYGVDSEIIIFYKNDNSTLIIVIIFYNKAVDFLKIDDFSAVNKKQIRYKRNKKKRTYDKLFEELNNNEEIKQKLTKIRKILENIQYSSQHKG